MILVMDLGVAAVKTQLLVWIKAKEMGKIPGKLLAMLVVLVKMVVVAMALVKMEVVVEDQVQMIIWASALTQYLVDQEILGHGMTLALLLFQVVQIQQMVQVFTTKHKALVMALLLTMRTMKQDLAPILMLGE